MRNFISNVLFDFLPRRLLVALTMSRTTVCRVDCERRTIRNVRGRDIRGYATNTFSFAVTRGQRGSFAVNATTGRSRFRQRDKRSPANAGRSWSRGQRKRLLGQRDKQSFASRLLVPEIAGYQFVRDCWLSICPRLLVIHLPEIAGYPFARDCWLSICPRLLVIHARDWLSICPRLLVIHLPEIAGYPFARDCWLSICPRLLVIHPFARDCWL